jgi:hypothetical protein
MNRVLMLLLACSCLAGACGQRTTNLVSDEHAIDSGQPGGDGDTNGHDSGSPPKDASQPVSDAAIALCDGMPCACSNGLDDDHDGLIDGFDGECTGPYDQDESSFATGEIEGNPNCADCYFDGNPSSQDDGCNISTSCIFSGTAEGPPGLCGTCDVSQTCIKNCLPRTANGCDCFGCCSVVTSKGTEYVRLAETCSLGELDDTDKCPRCMPEHTCENPCGRCELCPGKTLADLPKDCAGSGPGFTCEDGPVCSPELPCDSSSYCSQGCCIPIVL